MKKELHLFIIWNNAYAIKDKIISDISKDFEIEKIITVKWSKRQFAKNLMRFYGTKLRKWSFKERECGNGPFTLIIVSDYAPVYGYRHTTRGTEEFVNVKMFDKKQLYREWLGGNNAKIHATNSSKETRHDLMLLLGLSVEDFLDNKEVIPQYVKKDIVGSDGWSNMKQIFSVLNQTTEYVVLRNYDYLPDMVINDNHSDIDLLVRDFSDVAYILNAKKTYKDYFRRQYKCKIGKYDCCFDLRTVGDNYLDRNWEEEILASKVFLERGFYVPDERNYIYSLLYHAMVHKKNVSVEYRDKLLKLGIQEPFDEKLAEFMVENEYKYVEPEDLSVYFNESVTKVTMSHEHKAYIDESTWIKRIRKRFSKVIKDEQEEKKIKKI